MNKDIELVLFSEEKLHSVVQELGRQITADYQGRNLLLLSILKGSVVFMTLTRIFQMKAIRLRSPEPRVFV